MDVFLRGGILIQSITCFLSGWIEENKLKLAKNVLYLKATLKTKIGLPRDAVNK